MRRNKNDGPASRTNGRHDGHSNLFGSSILSPGPFCSIWECCIPQATLSAVDRGFGSMRGCLPDKFCSFQLEVASNIPPLQDVAETKTASCQRETYCSRKWLRYRSRCLVAGANPTDRGPAVLPATDAAAGCGPACVTTGTKFYIIF